MSLIALLPGEGKSVTLGPNSISGGIGVRSCILLSASQRVNWAKSWLVLSE